MPPKAEISSSIARGGPSDFTETSFGKRLLLLPFCYLLAFFPAIVIWSFVMKLAGDRTGMTAAILPLSYGIYCWLVAPLQMDPARRLKWALLGVPVVAGTWVAFIMAILFAICGKAFR